MLARSMTAVANRLAVIVLASQRRRRTETTSTSTRSGTLRSLPDSAARAIAPSAPSSPTTLARTEASTTITADRARRPGQRQPVPGQPARRGGGRSGRGSRPSWGALRDDVVLRPGTAVGTALVRRHGAAIAYGHRLGHREPVRSACLQ